MRNIVLYSVCYLKIFQSSVSSLQNVPFHKKLQNSVLIRNHKQPSFSKSNETEKSFRLYRCANVFLTAWHYNLKSEASKAEHTVSIKVALALNIDNILEKNVWSNEIDHVTRC